MNEMTIFENPEFGKVRTLTIDGEPWFVGKDVAEILGYSNTRDTLARHADDEDKGVVKHDTLGGAQDLTIVNESGLYSLIIGSKLPTAKKFKRWVTSEVLPAIRKTGGYGTDSTLSPELQVLIAHERRMREQQEKINSVQSEVDVMRDAMLLEPDDWRKGVRSAIGKLSLRLCGDYSMIHEIYQQMYVLLEDRAGVRLKARLVNKRERMARNGATRRTVESVTVLDVIEDDKKLKEICTSILREMTAKNI